MLCNCIDHKHGHKPHKKHNLSKIELSEDTQSQLKTISPSKLIKKVEIAANLETDTILQKVDDKN